MAQPVAVAELGPVFGVGSPRLICGPRILAYLFAGYVIRILFERNIEIDHEARNLTIKPRPTTLSFFKDPSFTETTLLL